MVGQVRTDGHGQLCALCTHAGAIELCTPAQSQWCQTEDHQFFALAHFDLLGSGSDAILACAYDGFTMILDARQHGVCFDFAHEVFAFTAGRYATRRGHNEPCLFYMAFGGKLHVFYQLDMTSLELRTLAVSQKEEEEE